MLRLEGHEDWTRCLAIHPDALHVLSGSYDRTARLWNLSEGRCILTLEGHEKPIIAVAIGPSGRRAVTASLDHTIGVWNLTEGRLERRFEAHTAPLADVRMIDDGTAVSVGQDRRVRIWNLATGDKVHDLPLTTPLDSVAVAPELLAAGDRAGNLWLFDRPSPMQLMAELQQLRQTVPHFSGS